MDESKIISRGIESRIEEFCQEVYASEGGTDLVQIQNFRNLAGFRSTRIHDKWLSSITVSATLNAFSRGVSTLHEKFKSHTLEKNILICNLLIEAEECDNKLLNEIIATIVESKNPLVAKLFSKILMNSSSGNVELSPSNLISIFKQKPQLLTDCLESLQGKTEKEVRNNWLVKAASNNNDLYTHISMMLQETNSSFLPHFIEKTSLSGSIIKYYVSYEQPCVILTSLPINYGSEASDLNGAKLMKELLLLWNENQNSVIRLLEQFPKLTEWVMKYCDCDVNAQRLCLHIINYQELHKL